jgi:hypothetical protein
MEEFQVIGEVSSMNFKEFSEFARAQQLHQVQDDAFGIYDIFPYRLSYNRQTASGTANAQGFTVWLLLDSKPDDALVKELRAVVHPFKVSVSQSAESGIRLSFPKKWANGETFDNVLSKTTDLLRNHGLSSASQCPICGTQNCDILLNWKGFYRPAHQSCVQSTLSTGVETARNKIQNGSYLTGILGALVGSFLGAIPSFLSIWFGNQIVAFLFALIPLGAYFGYKLAHGKMNHLVTVITIVASFVQLFVLEQMLFYFNVVVVTGLHPSIFDTITKYFQHYTVSDIVESVGMEVLFLLLGIWISWQMITKTGYSEVSSLQTTAATIQPYYNGSTAAQNTTAAAVPTSTTISTPHSCAEETYMKPEKDPWEN